MVFGLLKTRGDNAATRAEIRTFWSTVARRAFAVVFCIGIFLLGVYAGTSGQYETTLQFAERNLAGNIGVINTLRKFDAASDLNAGFSPESLKKRDGIILKSIMEIEDDIDFIDANMTDIKICEQAAQIIINAYEGTCK